MYNNTRKILKKYTTYVLVYPTIICLFSDEVTAEHVAVQKLTVRDEALVTLLTQLDELEEHLYE